MRTPAARSIYRVSGTVILAAALTGGLAACSSSSKSGTSSTTSTTSSAGSSTSTSGGTQATGSPVKIMLEGAISGPVYALPEMVTGAQAAVNRLNSQGGVGGHKVVLETCDDQGNPNNDAACGRKAVSDGVVSVVGGLSIYDTDFIPALAAAHIPYFASTDINPIDHTSPVSFPVNASATDYTAEGELLAQDGGGCTNAAVLGVNQPGTTDGFNFIKNAYMKFGGKTFKSYLYPNTQTDFTSFVATALANGAKCISMIGGPQAVVGIMTAVEKSGSKVPVNTNLATIVPALYAPVHFPSGELTVNGTYYVAGVNKPGVQQFESDMKATGVTGAAGADDTLAENAYQGVMMFAYAAQGVSDITGPNLLANVKNMTNVDTGLTPPFSLASPGVFPGYPQDHDNNEIQYTWTGTDLSLVKTFTVAP